ncbi:MAG: hypothetical protein LUG18_15975 [Candidatus Azobacteroides sp.]|nr:hypothetical protein [Candidatus Azobacteroides sp.]
MRTGHMDCGFFGRERFGQNRREACMQEWTQMSTEEKVRHMEEKMKMMEQMKHNFWGFFALRGLGEDMRNHFYEKWNQMSAEEKEAFIKEKEEEMKKGCFSHFHHPHSFFHEDRFSVEKMDHFCEQWLAKTPEEKEECIRMRKAAFHHGDFSRMGFFRDEDRMSDKEEEKVKD